MGYTDHLLWNLLEDLLRYRVQVFVPGGLKASFHTSVALGICHPHGPHLCILKFGNH